MIHETFPLGHPSRLSPTPRQTDKKWFAEIIQTAARIPRIDKIIDLWEESQDIDDGSQLTLFGLRRYIDYIIHYPIPKNKFYLDCDPNGSIGLTAYFDTYKLSMRFGMLDTITYIKWGDYSERLLKYGH